ncbi:IS701 family transposase [Desulfobacterales bacterium HSG17]|nr:IS701 family transposase [Desulfobacterales bacterium HSG17]
MPEFSHLERKSIEPIAVNVSGKESVRSMQRTISDAVWNEDEILHRHQNMVSEEMGDQDGILMFDESGFSKKGDCSAGVSRQHNGEIGKVDNCQNGVFAGYASPKGYTLVDERLFMPEKWFGDDYKEKRAKCKVPDDLIFKTKPELAAEMYRNIVARGILPFRYVVADSIYGNSLAFINAIESDVGKTYMVSVPYDTKFWLRHPVTKEHVYQYKGEQCSKRVLADKEKKPITLKDFATNLHKVYWYKRTVSEGSKGPIEYEFTKRNITLAKDGLPFKNVWLIIKRTVGKNPEYTYYISNAPVSTRLKTFVWLSGIRWSVEQCFQECKSGLGMGHYQVRKYAGWNRHMLTCILAHFFLWHIKIVLEGKAPSITLPQIRLLLEVVLPLKTFSRQETIDLVRWIQEKNHKAYLSHRKHKLGTNLSGEDSLLNLVMN